MPGSTRREWLSSLGAAALAGFAAPSAKSAGAQPVAVTIEADRTLGVTPDDFTGFGYEISSVATKGLLNAENRALIPFFATLGRRGAIRVGGNTSDYSIWSPDGQAIALPKGAVINRASIQDLGSFLKATGWDLIWGLNLGDGSAESAADQASAVAAAAGERLLCVQIGNEPDLYGQNGHRPRGYDYAAFHRDFQRFAEAIGKRTPGVPLAGPDVAMSPGWVAGFAKDESSNIRLLTEHYYATGPPDNPNATIANLLKTDEGLLAILRQLQSASNASRVPYRLVELNSCFGGGKPGLSDTFASALWGLDLMFTLASTGAAGINWETGLNHLGSISSYSPIWDDQNGHYSARPLYYALLAFAMAGIGERLQAEAQAAGINFKAWGVRARNGRVWLTLINKDMATGADVRVRSTNGFSLADPLYLSAPSYASTTGVTLGGAAVTPQGIWRTRRSGPVRASGGEFGLYLAPASAVLLRLS